MEQMGRRVNAIVRDCLYDLPAGSPAPTDAVLAEGVVGRFGFNPKKIEEHKAEIREMLLELPDEFQASKGGGWSFLNACQDRHGDLWGGQQTADELLCLGIAAGLAEIQLPREVWNALPGGVPYFVVKV